MPFAIGIEYPKREVNIGTLLRSAWNFNASMVFTVGRRYQKQSSDTVNAFAKIPILHFNTWQEYKDHAPMEWIHIGVELTKDASNVKTFIHPKQCVYVLGPEDGSISPDALKLCKYTVIIPSKRCLNVSVAGSIIMYDRTLKESP